jgi:hypothetical protein
MFTPALRRLWKSFSASPYLTGQQFDASGRVPPSMRGLATLNGQIVEKARGGYVQVRAVTKLVAPPRTSLGTHANRHQARARPPPAATG